MRDGALAKLLSTGELSSGCGEGDRELDPVLALP
jgi:hypothetical protein